MPLRFGVLRGALAWLSWRNRAPLGAGQLVLLMTLAFPVFAQIPGVQSAASSAQKETVVDPLGRSTPKGTISGFVSSVHRNDFVSAAEYMQVPAAQRSRIEPLARDLSELLDRYMTQPLATINDSPNGTSGDGLSLDRDRIGPLIIGGKSFDILLIHITDRQAGPIWLLSSETLAQVPMMHDSLEETWIQRVMPKALVSHSIFGISYAQWLVLAATLVGPLLLFSFLFRLLLVFARKAIPGSAVARNIDEWSTAIRRPAVIVAALVIHLLSLTVLGFPLNFRMIYGRVAGLVVIAALAWLLRRLSSSAFEHTRRMLIGRGQTGMRSLLLLAERLTNVVIVMVAIFSVLSAAGVDTGTALAGLGIGGIAVALGAQKSVENLLGGIFLLTDRALAVGDICNISGRQGTIEDITLRSVRLRTDQQTLLSIPAGALAQASIENFATRSKILVQTIIRLKYSTTEEQLRSVLDGVRRSLDANPSIDPPTSRIRLVEFGVRAIELELFAYMLTYDNLKFLQLREELLLQVARIVESSGTGFAQPTDFN